MNTVKAYANEKKIRPGNNRKCKFVTCHTVVITEGVILGHFFRDQGHEHLFEDFGRD